VYDGCMMVRGAEGGDGWMMGMGMDRGRVEEGCEGKT
jgi:hypothetical protein